MRAQHFGYTVLLVVVMASHVSAGEGGDTDLTLRVATAQIPVTRDISANSRVIHRALDFAIREEADILLTPEGSLSAYTPEFDQAEVDKQLTAIVKRASSAGIALALGTCYTEPDDKKCYNELRFCDAQGKFLGFHTKTLLCGSLTTPSKGEINSYSTRPLRTFGNNPLPLVARIVLK